MFEYMTRRLLEVQQAMRLCLVIGKNNCLSGSDPLELVKKAVQAGATSVQVREENEEEARYLAKNLKKTLPKDFPIVMNDHVELVPELNLKWLHIGQQDMPYQRARMIVGPDVRLGLSIENMQQAVLFQNSAVDYFGVGPVYTTFSNTQAAPPIGPQQFRSITKLLGPHRCVAIGGLTPTTIRLINTLGAKNYGVAVISAITKADCPAEATKALLEALDA